MIIQAFNPEVDDLEQTSLSTSVAAAATSLPVKNSNGFLNTRKVLVGIMGNEKSEIVTTSGVPTATAIPVSALAFPHSTDDPVYELRYDQVKFYKASSISGTYSVIATVGVDVDNDQNSTFYNDVAGLASDYYKTSFYDSVGAVESLLSDPIAGDGFNPMSAGNVVDEVMREVGDPEGSTATREEYFAWLNEVNYALQKRMRKPYDFLKARQTANPTAGNGIAYPTDLLHFDTIKYTYAVGGYSRVYNPIPVYEDQWVILNQNPGYMLNNDQIEYVYYDDVDQTIYTYPKFATNQVGTFVINYWKQFNHINSDGDILQTPDPQIYKAYLKANYYRKKSAREERFAAVSDRWFSDYNIELGQIVKYNRKNIGKPQSFRMEPQPSLRYLRSTRYDINGR